VTDVSEVARRRCCSWHAIFNATLNLILSIYVGKMLSSNFDSNFLAECNRGNVSSYPILCQSSESPRTFRVVSSKGECLKFAATTKN
jgi:hypothetical protein